MADILKIKKSLEKIQVACKAMREKLDDSSETDPILDNALRGIISDVLMASSDIESSLGKRKMGVTGRGH